MLRTQPRALLLSLALGVFSTSCGVVFVVVVSFCVCVCSLVVLFFFFFLSLQYLCHQMLVDDRSQGQVLLQCCECNADKE